MATSQARSAPILLLLIFFLSINQIGKALDHIQRHLEALDTEENQFWILNLLVKVGSGYCHFYDSVLQVLMLMTPPGGEI